MAATRTRRGKLPAPPADLPAIRPQTAPLHPANLWPLDYMLDVMRDETADPARRDDMAKLSAPYVHPKLATVQPGCSEGAEEIELVRFADEAAE